MYIFVELNTVINPSWQFFFVALRATVTNSDLVYTMRFAVFFLFFIHAAMSAFNAALRLGEMELSNKVHELKKNRKYSLDEKFISKLRN